MSDIAIRRASAADCEALGVVGPAAYVAAYAYLWDRPHALFDHLESFGAPAFRELMARPDVRVWVALSRKRAVGFLTMISGSPDPVRGRAGGAEIPRIYLLPHATGQGLGRRLFDEAVQCARDEGLTHVWLGVMASADRAVAAYRRWGFEEIGHRRFGGPLRKGYEEMRVLAMELTPPERQEG